MSKILKFPDGFLWGAATSAHQVEGNNYNDWSEWEKKNAEKLAREARTKYAKWQREKFPEMFEPANYISGAAADHYNRYESDFDIAKSLRHTAHRFSIEWSRVEPEEGKWDEKEIEHYRDVARTLRARGIEPFVTLWHWPLPIWLSAKGGWESPDAIDCFERYVRKIVLPLRDDVHFWITINEPEIYAINTHLKGIWPPQKKSMAGYFRCVQTLIRAHKRAYHAIKESSHHASVGTARDIVYFDRYNIKIIDSIFRKPLDWWWNYYFFNKFKRHQDFIGVNSYFRKKIGLKSAQNMSDMGWGLYSKTLYHSLIGLKKYKVPIYVTEHGLADADDSRRAQFIKESLRYLHTAIEGGVQVKGYLHWSLFDNFEWDKGFWPRFGLVAVDFKTQKRTIRPSAYEYAKICKENAIAGDD